MASQQGPPSRPWFRLATMVRPPTPQPDQPPPPRPALTIRTTFSQAPPPPQPQPPAANVVPPSRPMPPSSNPRTPPLMQQSVQATSPPPPSRSTPPSLTATMPPTTNRPTSLSPPKTVKTSPNNKPLSYPPSPMALPSPQLKSYYAPEYDQKSVLVQETKQKQPKGLDNGDLRGHMTPDTHNPTKKPEASKKHLDSEDHVGMRIITIAGENKGAIMELTPFGNKTSHKFGKKDNPTTASSTDGDTSNSKANNKNQKSPLIMNSNVQAVNNSILYNCSTTHHDPGIHFSLSTNPTGGRRSLHKDHMHKLND